MISLWEGCSNDFPLSNFKTCPSETTLDKPGLLRLSYQVLPGSFCLLSLLTRSGSWVHLQILLVIVTWQIIPSQNDLAYSSQAPLMTPGDRIRQLWAPYQAIVASQTAMYSQMKIHLRLGTIFPALATAILTIIIKWWALRSRRKVMFFCY